MGLEEITYRGQLPYGKNIHYGDIVDWADANQKPSIPASTAANAPTNGAAAEEA
jgi:hypothetical protein